MIWLLLIFFVAELFYFRIADKFRIIDKPNQRSSHSYITRRGGGIIFPLAWFAYSSYQGLHLPYFTLGLIIISAISFMDDIREVSVAKRISLHFISLSLAFYDLGIFNLLPWWGSLSCLAIGMAALNAINFMDGINGITGLYALVFCVSVALFAGHIVPDATWELSSPFPYLISALLVFGFFNFRKRAVCFAGDVGSVSMAYVMIGLTTFLIFSPEGALLTDATNLKSVDYTAGLELKYLLLLSVYGVDSFLTILHRLLLKENILKGHRKHLYQYLVNEYRVPHIAVAFGYAIVQFCINIWILNYPITILHAAVLLLSLSLFYVALKIWIINYSTLPAVQPINASMPLKVVKSPVDMVVLKKELKDVIPPVVSSRKTIYEQKSSRQAESMRG